MPPLLKSALAWVVTLLVPFVIIMLGARLLLTPVFLQVEYRMPGFPADPYGFTLEDRLRWATPSLLYLVNDRGIDYLADLRFDTGAPIYNERELTHMLDVKNVLQMLLNIWHGALVVLAVLGVLAWRNNWLNAYRTGWRRGGFLTIGMLIACAIFAVTSFWDFFTWFHTLFFEGVSWQFEYSDTLIRLFPMRFWADCFIYIGVFSLILGLILGVGLKPKTR